jgi:hypothetical protein
MQAPPAEPDLVAGFHEPADFCGGLSQLETTQALTG